MGSRRIGRLSVSLLAACAAGLGVSAVAAASAASPASGSRPVVTAVLRASGSSVGLAPVVLDGRRFLHVKSVMFGQKAAPRIRVLSAHRISVYAPPHGHGTVTVRVTTSAGTSRRVKHGTQYTYVYAHHVGTFPTRNSPVPRAIAAPRRVGQPVANSCPTRKTCYTVGSAAKRAGAKPAPIVQVRTGSKQSARLLPVPDDKNERSEGATGVLIDCPTAGSCAAVVSFGDFGFGNGSALDTLAHGTWHTYDALPPGGKRGSENAVVITSLSCGAPGECVAVGDDNYDQDNKSTGLIYTLHNGRWTVAELPVGSGTAVSADYVSCPSATWCGVHAEGGRKDYLVVDSGARFASHVMPSAPVRGDLEEIANLVCQARGRCTMVSEKTNYFVQYDHGRFTGVRVPAQPDAKDGSHDPYDAVSTPLTCRKFTCFATGSYQAAHQAYAGATRSVVVRIHGTTVTRWTMPEVHPGKVGTSLDGVSCTRVDHCVAIGTKGNFDHRAQGMYEVFSDGVWTPGVLRHLAGEPVNSDLVPTTVDCFAVRCTISGAYEYNAYHVETENYDLSSPFTAVQE